MSNVKVEFKKIQKNCRYCNITINSKTNKLCNKCWDWLREVDVSEFNALYKKCKGKIKRNPL